MTEEQLLKPKVLSHEKIYFETYISGNGDGGDGGCGDNGGRDGGWGGCNCIPIIIDYETIKALPGRGNLIKMAKTIGQILLMTSEGRFLLKRFYEIGPKVSTIQDQERTLQTLLTGVNLFQKGKIDEAKSYFNQELTKLELRVL